MAWPPPADLLVLPGGAVGRPGPDGAGTAPGLVVAGGQAGGRGQGEEGIWRQ